MLYFYSYECLSLFEALKIMINCALKINSISAYKASLIWEWIPKTAAFSKSYGKKLEKSNSKKFQILVFWFLGFLGCLLFFFFCLVGFLVGFFFVCHVVISLTPSSAAGSFITRSYCQFMKAKPQVHQINKNTEMWKCYTPVQEWSYSHSSGSMTALFSKEDYGGRGEDLIRHLL